MTEHEELRRENEALRRQNEELLCRLADAENLSVRDVTDRVETEEALRRSEARFRVSGGDAPPQPLTTACSRAATQAFPGIGPASFVAHARTA